MGFLRKPAWSLALSLHGHTTKNLKQLRKWQWLGSEALLRLQEDRLRDLLAHAYQHVPWYRELLGETRVVRPEGGVELARLAEAPLLDKSAIRTDSESLKSDDLKYRHWAENTSGGSTGEPVRLVQDKTYHDWNRATKLLHDEWTGHSVGERRIRLWGSERDLWVGRETAEVRLRRWLRNETWLNTFRMTPQKARKYIDTLNSLKPKLVTAYVESVYDIARLLESERIPVHSPDAIVASAGTLYPEMRSTIERVFKAPVFNLYGSREVGDIACECDHHKGLHVSPLTHYVEILRPDGSHAGPGELGEIVVTLLTNYAMPLVRYRIGDVGVWAGEPCTCGRSWPLLKEVSGRVTDVFLARDGTRTAGNYFTHLFFFRNWVRKFQVVQETFDNIQVFIVPENDSGDPEMVSRGELDEIREKIQVVMGEDCRVAFNFVDEIPPSPSGKYRYNISKVSGLLAGSRPARFGCRS